MSKRIKYSVGDVFAVDLGDALKGYGRILKIDEPSLFIELFKVSPKHEQTLETLANSESILSIWCSNVNTGLLWQEIDGVKCPKSAGNSGQRSGEAVIYCSFPLSF